MTKNKQIIPLPFTIYFWTVAALVLAGVLDSVYLSISHYRVYTDIAYESFCAISKSINCDTVSQSPYSVFIGIPVPVWGIMGYSFFMLFLAFARYMKVEKQRIWPILFIISLSFSSYSVILAYISTFYIHSYCMMCIVSFGINFLLLYYTWLIRKRFDQSGIIKGLKLDIVFLWEKKKTIIPVFLLVLCMVISLLLYFPAYWNISPPTLSTDIPQGRTDEGYPWIGAEKPVLEITEFTDYQCFQCKKMHFFLRKLVEKNSDKIRLIHRHFPMDHKYNPLVKDPFHVGSGKMAIFAEYAQTQGKFWEMNDVLFTISGNTKFLNVKNLAEKVGLDSRALSYSTKDRTIRYKVKHDIAVGIKLGINGTPGYVIGGKVYLGQIPPEVLSRVLD
ncbi:MAG: thioredoxin domain-containing protein [Desulfobacterales bacterium]|nr:thioredoxin domain-containing protein [Deltaproteobacteria bacterium]NNL41870.1 thioredoxin domain-containing protein [Desulfobacterales bacterium]